MRIEQDENCCVSLIIGLTSNMMQEFGYNHRLTLSVQNMETAHNFFKVITEILE